MLWSFTCRKEMRVAFTCRKEEGGDCTNLAMATMLWSFICSKEKRMETTYWAMATVLRSFTCRNKKGGDCTDLAMATVLWSFTCSKERRAETYRLGDGYVQCFGRSPVGKRRGWRSPVGKRGGWRLYRLGDGYSALVIHL